MTQIETEKAERRTFTYEQAINFLHLRNDKGTVLPQRITFGIYPRDLDAQINVLGQMSDWFPDADDQSFIQKSRERLLKIRESCDLFDGFFIPMKDGEWSEYVQKKVSKRLIACRHLCTPNGDRLYTDEDEPFVKNNEFLESAYEAILEASRIRKPIQDVIALEKQRLLMELKKSQAKRMTPNPMTASISGTSSPNDSGSNPGAGENSSLSSVNE